ncbi:MAG: T9SS type A sorting domain-containing protein, partial [Ignavibacteria bacterium]
PNNNILTFNSGTFEILSGGTVSNSGTFKTEDTVSLNLRNGSSFNAPVVVSNGITTATDLYSPIIGRLYGSVTIDNGATLFVQNGGYFLEVYGDLINNGTISGIGSTFIFKGSSFNNSGNVNVNVLSFDSTLNLSGIGNFTGNNVYIGSSGNVTLTSENDFSVNNLFSIKNGGVLNLNNNILKFTSGTFEVLNGSTVNNSGSFQTENNVTLNLRDGSNFAAPLKVLNGITSATDNSSPITGKLYGPVTIDSGATLSVRNGGYTLNFYDDLTNNGSLTGSGSTLRFFGPVFTNNGNVSPTNFFFETGAHTLQGTGDWSVNANILTGSVTTLGSDHQMHSVLINAGGTFDITSYTLKLSQNGTPLINNGIFTTTMSTVEYNGVAGQLVAITNVEYYSLTINNPAHVNIFAPKTIPGTLSILDGVFTNGANITMGDGAAIVRRDGSLSAVPTFGVSVDVFYIGTNPTASSVELPAATSVLRDLTINNSGGVNLTDSRTVNRTLYLTNGTFTNGAYLTLFNGVIIDRAEGVLNSVPSFPVTVNVVYSGNSTISTGAELPVSTTVLQKLEVNKSGSVLLSSDITVNDTMKVILGSFNLNGFIITMGPAAYLTETPGNTVMGSAGYLVANRDLNAPTALNVAGLGAIFTTSQNMGMTEVIRGHTIQVEDTLESMERYYDISPANNSGLNATFVFKYDDSELNGFNPNNLVLFKSTNNGVNWFYEPSSNNPFAKEITSVGVNSFSKWTAGDATNSLPVELASFSSNVNGRNVSLNWSTSSEINNSGFEIERSLVSNSGNSTWKKIGYREGNGNSTSGNSYSFSDNNLNTGMYSYRLKQIDFNGSFEYHNLSNDVEIGVPTEFNLSQNYPNPFNPSTKIDFQIPENGNVKITLYDMTGREVAVILNEVKEAGYYNVNFNGSNLSTGAYFYRINANDFTATKKMTLIK